MNNEKIRFYSKLISLVALIAFFGSCSSCGGSEASKSELPNTAPTGTNFVTAIADEYLSESLSFNPELTYFMPLGEPIHDRFTDNSIEALNKWHQKQDAWLVRLNNIDASTLEQRQWILHGSMIEVIEADIGIRICRNELWNVNPDSGWHMFMPIIIEHQPIEDEASREVALARWKKFPVFVDREIEKLRQGLKEGYSAPKRSVSSVISQFDSVLGLPLEESPYLLPARTTQDHTFGDEWRVLATKQLLVALKRYRDFLANEYLDKAREEVAVSTIPNGAACYDANIRYHTTQKSGGRHVFELGKKMVADNQKEIARLGEQLYLETDFAKIMVQASSKNSNRFEDTKQVLSFAKQTTERAFLALPKWFEKVPTATATVEPWPDYLDNGSLTDQYEAPKSEGDEGIYRISLKNALEKDKSGLEITTIHELYPGHHLQISTAQENKNNHPAATLLGNTAYVEGWARYAERLAEEMGLYQVEASKIVLRAWPARGMVVDPGVHLDGWTEEQAVTYIMDSGVMDRQMAQSLYERIVAIPGQLTSYDVGASVFFDLRRKAETTLGDKFDIREFHTQLLENDAVPLWMLKEHVHKWIDKKR